MERRIGEHACTNPFSEAIARAGGPTKLGKLIGMTYSRVKQIARDEDGLTNRADVAKKVQDAVGVPAVELLGLEPWNPDARPAPDGNGKSRRGEVLDFPSPPPAAAEAVDQPVAAPDRSLAGLRAGSVARPPSSRSSTPTHDGVVLSVADRLEGEEAA